MQKLSGRGRHASWDTDLAKRLYLDGKTDREIADAVGAPRSNITNWRNRLGMAPHHAKNGPGRRVDYNELRRLYDMGLTQEEIQQRMKVSHGTIYAWLAKNNLPPCSARKTRQHVSVGVPGETPARPRGQKMFMSDSEILASMRRCENRRDQVQILADLNACSRSEMLKYLTAIGEDTADLQRRGHGKINHAKALKLWKGGASDGELAEHMGVAVSGVVRWRKRHGLQVNCKEVQGE